MTDTGCALFAPIYVSKDDQFTDLTARQVLVHNEVGKRACGWEAKSQAEKTPP